MDQNILVTGGHALLDLLDSEGIPPRAALWVINSEADSRKLWIVPYKSITDSREFYRRLSTVMSANRNDLHGIEPSDIEMVKDDHPAIKGLRQIFTAPGKQAMHMMGSTFSGFFLPDSIILRVDL